MIGVDTTGLYNENKEWPDRINWTDAAAENACLKAVPVILVVLTPLLQP